MSTAKRLTSSGEQGSGRSGEREIEVVNRQRLCAVDQDVVAKLARAALDCIGRRDEALTIIFVRDRAMRRLNRDYRGIDQPTDVLSFAYHEGEEIAATETESRHLGDVVISVETAGRYAREHGLTFDREIEHLIIHGALHLAGYDHETDNGEMNKIERKLRKELL